MDSLSYFNEHQITIPKYISSPHVSTKDIYIGYFRHNHRCDHRCVRRGVFQLIAGCRPCPRRFEVGIAHPYREEASTQHHIGLYLLFVWTTFEPVGAPLTPRYPPDEELLTVPPIFYRHYRPVLACMAIRCMQLLPCWYCLTSCRWSTVLILQLYILLDLSAAFETVDREILFSICESPPAFVTQSFSGFARMPAWLNTVCSPSR